LTDLIGPVFGARLVMSGTDFTIGMLSQELYGATGTGSRCGSDYSRRPWSDSYVHQRAFVLATDGKAIDVDQTRLIFGAPAGQKREFMFANVPGGSVPAGAEPFRPMADSIEVFKYEGRFYIETEDEPESKNARLPPVRVFLREHGVTRQVCALRPQSVPVPVD
jgi:hypothetical protein